MRRQNFIFAQNVLFFLMAVLLQLLEKQTEVLAVLPSECENFTLIMGNPFKAKILILGEIHEIADEERYLCTRALLQELFFERDTRSNKVTVLFEEHGRNEKLDCKEKGLNKLASDCRGWNIDRHDVDMWYERTVILKDLHKMFSDKFKSLSAIKKLSKWKKKILEYLNHLTKLEKKQFIKQQLQEIRERVIRNESSEEILLYLSNQTDHYAELYHHFVWEDHENSFVRPNEEMLEAIREAANPSDQTVVVYTGNSHVNLRSPKLGLPYKVQEDSVRKLLNGLQASAHKNPYAIFSYVPPKIVDLRNQRNGVKNLGLSLRR